MIIVFELLISLLGLYLKKKKKNLNIDKVLFTNKFIMALFLMIKKIKRCYISNNKRQVKHIIMYLCIYTTYYVTVKSDILRTPQSLEKCIMEK